MNDKEKLEIWKRKLIEAEDKARNLGSESSILANLLNETKTSQNIKLNILLRDLDLEEEISHLKGWIKFHEEEAAKYKNKIETAERELPKQEPEKAVEEVKSGAVIEEKQPEKEKIESIIGGPAPEVKEETKESIEVNEPEERKVKTGDKEKSEEEIVKQELEELDKESKTIIEKEKELRQKGEPEESEIEIPSPEELEKEAKQIKEAEEGEKPARIELRKEEKLKVKEKEEIKEVEKPELDLSGLENEKVESEKPIVQEKQFVEEAKAVEEIKPAKIKKSLGKKAKKPGLKIKELFGEEEKSIEKLWEKEEKPKIEAREEETKKQIKELFEGPKGIRKLSKFKEKLRAIKEPITNISKTIRKIDRRNLIRYAAPAFMLLLIVSILFISESTLTGWVTLTREETYTDNLDLIINESGNYTWAIGQPGDIEAIKASGRIKGNGTVKIYIEKDGERYLIYDNKAVD